MICPVCRADMLAVEHGGVEVDHCPDCGGTWCDRGEMQLLVGREGWEPAWREGAGPGAEAEAGRRCPRCGKAMRKWSLGGITVDRCPKRHGIWFDRGELEGVVRADLPGDADVLVFVKDLFGGEGGGD